MKAVNFDKQYTDGIESIFSSIIRKKRVILVGPARTLVGTKMGSEIDGYDIVVRTNNFFGVSEEMHPDYGKRCDVLYLNPKTTRMYGLGKNGKAIEEIEKRRGTLYSPVPLSEWGEKGLSAMVKFENDGIYIRNNSSVALKKIPLSITTISRYNQLGFKVRPLLGIAATADLLRYRPASLHITGFDFYTNGRTWIDGYPTVQVDGSHNYRENARYLKSLLDENIITVDDNLRLIIERLAVPRKKKSRGVSWR